MIDVPPRVVFRLAQHARDDRGGVPVELREERFDRPTQYPKIQSGTPRAVCGTDRRAGGTWLGVNQHGAQPRQVLERPGLRVWLSRAPGGTERYVAVFNLDDTPRQVDLAWADLGLGTGPRGVRDLWQGRSLGSVPRLRADLPPHGSALFRVGAGRKTSD